MHEKAITHFEMTGVPACLGLSAILDMGKTEIKDVKYNKTNPICRNFNEEKEL